MAVSIKQTETFRKWERKLKDSRAQTAIAARLARLSYGLAGDMQSVGDGVSELRIHYGPGYRLYLTWRGNELVVLLCGGDKDSQGRDITLAKKMARDLGESDD
jgi:putative addiction module killer protein